jgi:hypothetical protein
VILWVGAGLVGMIGLVTSDLADGAPRAFVPAVGSLIIAGAGSFALARIRFEWAATTLEREIHDADAARDPEDTTSKKADQNLRCDLDEWPKGGEFFYRAEIYLVAVAAIVYLVAVWWAAFS